MADRPPSWAGVTQGRILHTDASVLVLDKPVGWSVMGERHDTDLVRLAAASGLELWPVHRIDKITSGVVLFAQQLAAHGDLTRQFGARTVDKTYLAITRGTGLPEHGTIELPLSTGRKNRVRVAAPRDAITRHDDVWAVADESLLDGPRYPSTTRFERLAEAGDTTLLAVRPGTGRRHQIRVHLAWIGFPLVGDPLFERAPRTRAGLHAWKLAVDHDSRRVDWEARPDAEFLALGGYPDL